MSSTVLLAGGGTGGHVFPLVAVAQALVRLCPEVHPIFVGTRRGMETRFVPERGFELELLDVLPIRGGGLAGAFKGALRAAETLPASRRLIRKHGARGVFSVGGYASGPISMAARLEGLPVALLEPNSVMGLANWLVSPFVQRAYTAFPMTENHFAPSVVLPTGVPLRPGFDPAPYRLDPSRIRILVLGGSQGAKTLNESLPQALAKVSQRISVVHQCGQAHIRDVQAEYSAIGASFAEVTPFIEDMPGALAEADLVVARSGAGAVSEIAAVGRPSVLIPYPFASGDHQFVNARVLQDHGAAVCVDNAEATAARLGEEIDLLCRDPERLRRMASAARDFGRPDAAEVIARDFLRLCGLGHRSFPEFHGQASPASTKKPLSEVA